MVVSVVVSVIVSILFLARVFIPLSMLIRYGKYDAYRYLAFLTLKPAITDMIWIFAVETNHEWLFNLEYPYPSNILLAVIRILPDVILTSIILYWFRHLFNRHKLMWIFLFFDLIRSLTVFATMLVQESPYTDNLFKFMVLFYPGIYALAGLVAVINSQGTPLKQK